MNYNTFKELLKNSVKNTFTECIERIPKTEINGFGIYSDESVMSLSISCNTFEYLKEQQNSEPGYDVYFKWTMDEWKYEMINQKEFAGINKELLIKYDEINKNQDAFIRHRTVVFNLCVQVLEELKEQQLFDGMRDEFILMFGVSEFDDKPLEKEFVKRLNSNAQYSEFAKWIDSE